MKTIINNTTKLSKYIFNDDIEIEMSEFYIRVNNCEDQTYLTDVNENNATIILNVTPPIDWEFNKYRFENDIWILSNGLELLTLEEAKIVLLDQLKKLRKSLSATVNECLLINDVVPPELASLMNNSRDMYTYGKYEIDSLTEDNYKNYVLEGPMVNALMVGFQEFL